MLKDIVEKVELSEADWEAKIAEALEVAESKIAFAMSIADKLKEGKRLKKVLDPMTETLMEEVMFVQKGEYS